LWQVSVFFFVCNADWEVHTSDTAHQDKIVVRNICTGLTDAVLELAVLRPVMSHFFSVRGKQTWKKYAQMKIIGMLCLFIFTAWYGRAFKT
jgi:hypothetical protein